MATRPYAARCERCGSPNMRDGRCPDCGWRPNRAGQAIAEFALVAPIMLFLLLAILEMGSFGARWVRWQSLASQMAVAARDDALPPWWADEAGRAQCGDPDATLTGGDPVHVTLMCSYDGIAVNGLVWRVTLDAIAAVPPTPAPSPTPSASEASS